MMAGVAWADYAVFAVMVLLSGLLAVYSRLSSASSGAAASGKRAFSFATGTVSSGAVLMSIARTGIGIRVFLGKTFKHTFWVMLHFSAFFFCNSGVSGNLGTVTNNY
jgi:hypothetical protein